MSLLAELKTAFCNFFLTFFTFDNYVRSIFMKKDFLLKIST